MYLDMPLNHKIFLAQFDTIRRIADEGPCVIVGRRADLILRDKAKLLSVFICASEESRIRHVMEREHMTEKEARQRVAKADRERAAYYNQASSAKWGEPGNYDLCVNTDHLTMDAAAQFIVNAVKQ